MPPAADIPDVVIPPRGPHTHTAIFLHGSYYDWNEWEGLDDLVAEEAKRAKCDCATGIKYIFPTSPTDSDGNNFWFAYLADDDAPEMQNDNDVIDLEQWKKQTQRILSIVAAEARLLGDSRRILIAGNSAGAQVAAHVALQFSEPLGALMFLRSCPMRHTLGPNPAVPLEGEPDGSSLLESNKDLPIFVYMAGKDDTYTPKLQKRSYRILEDAGYEVIYKKNPTGTHEEDDPEENRQAAEWVVAAIQQSGGSKDKGQSVDSGDDESTDVKALSWWCCTR